MSTESTMPTKLSKLTTEHPRDGKYRILSLDGGGAKGFYTLGVLREIEALLNCPLYKHFDLVFGTSTGAIIAALIALGYEIEEIHQLYKEYVPAIMKRWFPTTRTWALEKLAKEVFGDQQFTDVKTGIGIVTTKWMIETPMIFKANVEQAYGRKSSFIPGFGVSIADAVQGSCSAYPFFKRKTITTATSDIVEIGDGGFCANNPTLYAIADAVKALKIAHSEVRVISIGCGVYPTPKISPRRFIGWCLGCLPSVKLLQKVLEINTQSMDQLRAVLYSDIQTVRVNEKFQQPELAADLMEHNLVKLNKLRQRGVQSFADLEAEIKTALFS
ncbi:MAG: patatin-like phospholipase family protein [Pirellulales bacterium]|nr:patatin-like phospholipase family protein [Pirellulales bacterium]